MLLFIETAIGIINDEMKIEYVFKKIILNCIFLKKIQFNKFENIIKKAKFLTPKVPPESTKSKNIKKEFKLIE